MCLIDLTISLAHVMSTNEQDTKKSREEIPGAPAGSLFAFDEFDIFLMIFSHADSRVC
jgi:hypothetical protein